MSANPLLHCSEVGCTNLVYLDEAVPGKLIPLYSDGYLLGLKGRYCIDCARSMGYWPPLDHEAAKRLLESSGLIGRGSRPGDRVKKLVKPRPPTLTPGQLEMGLE